MLNGLDLFSGIGGLTTALDGYVRPLVYCESDRYCQAVLLSNQQQGILPCAPIWDDVRTLQYDYFPSVDIIYGGFPCQDLSVAGAKVGLGGERSGLFFEVIRLAKEIEPEFIFLENVPGIRKWLTHIGMSLADFGYDCRWDIISAKEVGAPFEGKRWFCLASGHNGFSRGIQPGRRLRTTRSKKIPAEDSLEDGTSSKTNGARVKICRHKFRDESKHSESLWAVESNDWDKHASLLLRVDDGIPYRSYRLKALGNAVVPIQAREAFMRLMGIK